MPPTGVGSFLMVNLSTDSHTEDLQQICRDSHYGSDRLDAWYLDLSEGSMKGTDRTFSLLMLRDRNFGP